MTVLARTTTTLAHEVRVRHAALQRPLEISRAVLSPAAWGWRVRVGGGGAIVTSRTDAAAPPAHVDLVLAHGPYRATLVLPPIVPGQPPGSVRVALTAPVVEVEIAPAPMALVVELVDQGTGAPRAGRTVRVVPATGPAIALAETAVPGTYRSAERVWTSDETPADLVVGTASVRMVSLDFTRVQTRIRVADPT